MGYHKKNRNQNPYKERPASSNNPSESYINHICHLYGNKYDDREEDSKPGGMNWHPGIKAAHRSISSFQHDLREVYGIALSRSKIQKILISGGRWSTERSREVQRLFEEYTLPLEKGGKGLSPENAIRDIAAFLGISTVSVSINLPYQKTVYDLDDKTANAKRIERHRKKK